MAKTFHHQILGFVALIILFLSGIQPVPHVTAVAPAPLVGRPWYLVSINDATYGVIWREEGGKRIPTQAKLVLGGNTIADSTSVYEDPGIGLDTGCNVGVGNYTFTSTTTVRIELSGLTALWCSPQQLMDRERALVAALNGSTYEIVRTEQGGIDFLELRTTTTRLIFSSQNPVTHVSLPILGR